jgi:hypothetical protein
MALPNFIIIGAARSGTTSLYEYLRQHPQVYMSPLKETNYFLFGGEEPSFGGPDGRVVNRDSVYRREDYENLFAGRTNQIAVGEASPKYLPTPGTARRIRELLPDARLIAILRNPVQQSLSQYSFRRRDGWEPCATLAEAIEDEPRRLREGWAGGLYLQRGLYARHLREYLEHFPPDRVRVYLYDELAADPDGLLRDLFRFLGVDDSFVPEMSSRFNVSGEIRNPVLRFLWTRTHALQAALRPLLPKPVRLKVSSFFTSRPKRKLVFDEEDRVRLRDYFRDDIRELQAMIGKDLSSWLD